MTTNRKTLTLIAFLIASPAAVHAENMCMPRYNPVKGHYELRTQAECDRYTEILRQVFAKPTPEQQRREDALRVPQVPVASTWASRAGSKYPGPSPAERLAYIERMLAK